MQILTSLGTVTDSESHHWYHLKVSSESTCPSARVGHSLIYVSEENCVFCIGGANLDGVCQNLFRFNLNSLIWKQIPSDGFDFRYEQSTFVAKVGDSIRPFVFGGADTSGNRNDLQMWSSDNQHWKSIVPEGVAPSPRTQHSCAVSNGLLYVFSGGAVGTEPVSDRSVFVFDPAKTLWSCMETTGASPCPRQGHCMVTTDDKIYVHGGMNGEDFYDDMYVLDIKNRHWLSLDPSGPRPSSRAAHGAVGVEESIYIFGGLGCGGVLNDFFRFHTKLGYWQKIELGNDELPSPRLDFAVCCVKLGASCEIPSMCTSLNATSNSGTNKDEPSLCCGNERDEKQKTRHVILLHGGMDTCGNMFDDFYIYCV